MALGKVILQLYIYDGLVDKSLTSTDLKYTITKDKISTHDKINLEIGELVRDYIDVVFNDDYISITKWVKAVVTYYDDTGALYTINNSQETFTYLALDGYGYWEDAANPALSTNALMTSNNIYLPENTTGKLPIFAEGVGKVVIDSATTDIVNASSHCRGNDGNYSADNCNDTAQKILYITIPANSSTIQVFDTNETSLLKTIKVTNICEPKFTPFKITFVNKYGAFQDLYAFKKQTETLTVTDEKFNRNIIKVADSTYNTYEGEVKRYNIGGQTSISLNTGFVEEDMNTTIEELFLSQNVWIRYESKTLPVIAKSKTLNFKTSLNDKLINYTLDFDFAFDKVNNVR
jgi:hypothetical protein